MLFVKLDQARTSGDSAVAPGTGGKLGLDSRSPVTLDNDAFSDDWACWIVASKFQMVCLPIESLFSSAGPAKGDWVLLLQSSGA